MDAQKQWKAVDVEKGIWFSTSFFRKGFIVVTQAPRRCPTSDHQLRTPPVGGQISALYHQPKHVDKTVATMGPSQVNIALSLRLLRHRKGPLQSLQPATSSFIILL